LASYVQRRKFELPTDDKPVRRQRRAAAMAIAGPADDPEGVSAKRE
jgi:hypothetical protein